MGNFTHANQKFLKKHMKWFRGDNDGAVDGTGPKDKINHPEDNT